MSHNGIYCPRNDFLTKPIQIPQNPSQTAKSGSEGEIMTKAEAVASAFNLFE